MQQIAAEDMSVEILCMVAGHNNVASQCSSRATIVALSSGKGLETIDVILKLARA